MEQISAIAALRERIAGFRKSGHRIGFVPTMGNLHDGHLSLVDLAREAADKVIVSVFVNPTQFVPGEDFHSYPRTLDEDRAWLEGRGCDVLFVPEVAEVYPDGVEHHTLIRVPDVSDGLCGSVRPGHFEGVATVVAKLFSMVQPDLSVFGEKDFQQLQVIRKMVRDLNLPVKVLSAPTVRESDGLAMSSRNRYLGAEERRRAPSLYASLCAVREAFAAGRSPEQALDAGHSRLAEEGVEAEYLELRRAEDLRPPTAESEELVVLIAARIGAARLIDNLVFSLDPKG